ncbi:hypothetical protein FRC00_003997 [Tulasnella sp. 408]|nr:hypothetical protein FRC00_003997 [Tulasnella sp. 408]
MTAVRKDEEVGGKIIAVSQIEYQQVTIGSEPSQTATPSQTPPTPSRTLPEPSQPAERLPSPPAELPPMSPDNGVLVLALAGMTLVCIWLCFKLWLLEKQSRRAPERQSLIGNSQTQQPGGAVGTNTSPPDILPPIPSYGALEARTSPTSNLAGHGSSSGSPPYSDLPPPPPYG